MWGEKSCTLTKNSNIFHYFNSFHFAERSAPYGPTRLAAVADCFVHISQGVKASTATEPLSMDVLAGPKQVGIYLGKQGETQNRAPGLKSRDLRMQEAGQKMTPILRHPEWQTDAKVYPVWQNAITQQEVLVKSQLPSLVGYEMCDTSPHL